MSFSGHKPPFSISDLESDLAKINFDVSPKINIVETYSKKTKRPNGKIGNESFLVLDIICHQGFICLNKIELSIAMKDWIKKTKRIGPYKINTRHFRMRQYLMDEDNDELNDVYDMTLVDPIVIDDVEDLTDILF